MKVSTNIGVGSRQITSDTVVEFLLELFERRGPESYLGEDVSMAAHMEQTAYCAKEDGAEDELIAAGLLHDIGHFVADFPVDALEKGHDNFHQDAGANLLQQFFPPEVSEPVRLHVAAKRYLCAVDPTYVDRLSSASVHTLGLQGGPMDAAEVVKFEANPHHKVAVKLRYYDDDGKIEGRKITGFATYQTLLMSLITSG